MNERTLIPGDCVNWTASDKYYYGVVVGESDSPVIKVQSKYCNSKPHDCEHVVQKSLLIICK